MRFVRLIAGMTLLTIGMPVLFVGGALWNVTQHRDPGGAFGATLQQVETAGRAIVVPDLDALLRREAPFVRMNQTGLRIIARTGTDLAFVGIAPTNEVSNYLAAASYARLDQVSLANGLLPIRAVPLGAGSGQAVGNPGEQAFWMRHGVGVLDLDQAELRGRRLSLVIMHPDARAGVTVDLRAEVRPGWLDPAAWGLLAAGVVLAILGLAMLAWPVRPREVVFVVEPSQVPGLAARLGVSTLNDLGRPGPAKQGPGAAKQGFGTALAEPESGTGADERQGHASVPVLDLVAAAVGELESASISVDLGVLPAASAARSARPDAARSAPPALTVGAAPNRPITLACLLANEGRPQPATGPDPASPPVWPPAVPPGVRPALASPSAMPIRPAPAPAKPVPGRPAPIQPAPDRPGKPVPVRPVPAKPTPVRPAEPVPARVEQPAQCGSTVRPALTGTPTPLSLRDARVNRSTATSAQSVAETAGRAVETAGRAATKRRNGYRMATGSANSESVPVLRASSPGPDRQADSGRRRTGDGPAKQPTSSR